MPADSLPIGRLRARLTTQVGAPFVVSETAQQHVFDEDSAAYADIDIRDGTRFVVAVVTGTLPFEELVVEIWHRFVPEVWLVDVREEAIYVARRDASVVICRGGDTLRSPALPGVAIAIRALFDPPS